MATVIDMDDVQPSSTDLDEMLPLLSQVIGKPFLFLRASYGDELTVHLGVATAYSNPRLKSLPKGSFIAATRASAWILESGAKPGQFYTSDDDKLASPTGPSRRTTHVELREIENLPTIQLGALVTNATASPAPGGLMLSMGFSDGSGLVVRPRPLAPEAAGPGDEGEDVPISDWEIFMPRHRILQVGPGPVWSYTDSSKPDAAPPA